MNCRFLKQTDCTFTINEDGKLHKIYPRLQIDYFSNMMDFICIMFVCQFVSY